MDKMHKAKLFLLGIEVTLKSDDINFVNTATGSLYFFNRETDKNQSLLAGRKLFVTYLSKKKHDNGLLKGFRKIGLNAYVKGNTYIFFDGDVVVQMEKAENDINILAYPLIRKDIKGRIKKYIKGLALDYFLLIRKLVIFPAFYLLENGANVFLLHGSAIEHKGEGIICAGLAGVGKTTMAVSLALDGDNGIRFLTDNFLLYDEHFVYPFPEYIRLRDDGKDIVKNYSRLGKPAVRRFGRDHYVMPDNFISGRVKLRALFIIQLTDSYYIRELSLDKAIDRLFLANDHVKEFHNYHYVGLVDYLEYNKVSIYKEKIRVLESLLSKGKIYEVGIVKGQDPKEWLAKVEIDAF